MESAVEILERNGIRPTPNRILVVREMIGSSRPISLADLEVTLESMDRASIFRVLELLAEREVVHVIEDGSRSLKYELCGGGSHHSISDQHVHFFCENCRETFCLKSVQVPSIEVPEGYSVKSVNYLLKGVCPKCGGK